MRVCLSVMLAVALLAIACQETALAQTRTNSLGSSISPSRTSAGSSGAGVGSRNRTGSSGGLADTSAGQIQGSERFIRGNRQPGEFVGAGGDSSGGTGGFVGSQMAGAGTTGSQGMQGLSSLAKLFGGQSNQSAKNSRDSVRARVRLGFKVVRPVATDVVPRLQLQLGKIIQPRSSSPIQIEVEKGTATLRGAVASAHDRAIAERLVLLEGGIWKVKNELTVSEAESPPSPK